MPVVLSGLFVTSPVLADFSAPPDSPYRGSEPPSEERPPEGWPPPLESSPSLFRFQVGPALLAQPLGPGLITALDIGKRAVGARLSATWLRSESARGLAAYDAELWIDFRHRYELHPVLGAGASFMHGGALGKDENLGAGVLRGALEYELPIEDADARLALNVITFVPAIATDRTRPWVVGGVMVGVGF
jgi:hypothetical protein